MSLRPVLISILLSTTLVTASHAAECRDRSGPISLSSSVERALCHAPELRLAQGQADLKAATLRLESSALRPSASVSGALTEQHPASLPAGRQQAWTAGMEWQLWDDGATQARVDAAQSSLQASDALVAAQRLSLAREVSTAWLDLARAQAQQDVSEQNAKLADQLAEMARARYEAGWVTRADVLQAEADQLNARHTVERWQLSREVAAQTLLKWVGGEVAVIEALEPTLAALSEAVQALETADRQVLWAKAEASPVMLAQRHQVEAGDASLTAARKFYGPKLTVGVELRAAGEPGALSESTQLNARLTVPLYTGGAREARTQQAYAQRQLAQDTLWQTERDLRTSLATAHAQLRQSGQEMRSADASVTAAQAAQDIAQGRYAAGVGTLTEVLQAQASLAQARQAQAQAKVSRLSAAVTLSYLTGDLIALFDKEYAD